VRPASSRPAKVRPVRDRPAKVRPVSVRTARAPQAAAGQDAAARRAAPARRRPALRTPTGDRPDPHRADPHFGAGRQQTPAAGQTEIRVSGPLAEPAAAAVLSLVALATEEDRVSPLSEHVMLHLRYGGDSRARNLLLYRGQELAGYAHLDPTDPVAGPSGELVIHPARRRHGLGLALVHALVTEAGQRPLRLWAHGDLPAASRLAAAAGFERARALWQMRRSLQAPLAEPQLADGVTIRTFVVGRDEDDWTDLNSRAFARHPEQGAWTRADLDLREREPWFDPAGFFLAERAGKVVGFHWTKIHGRGDDAVARDHEADGHEAAGQHREAEARDHEAAGQHHEAEARGHEAGDHGHEAGDHGHEAIGEVYVVGVDPAERGTGLGRALTLVGLRYLRDRGLVQVMLYVDADNTPAIRLYESLGFTHRDTDVMFGRTPAGTTAAS